MKFLMNYFHHTFSRPVLYFIGIATLLAGFLYVVMPKSAFADDPSATNSQRLVTIHDNGGEITIVTRAVTVGDALKQADVTVSSRDIVEPSQSEKLVAKTYQVNVFRARPVVVTDGNTQVRVMTAEQSPRQIAKAAGMTLFDEDATEFQRVDSVLDGGGAGVTMVIHRATAFNFTLYGKRFVARTQAHTVGELLKEKKITLGSADGVSPAQTAVIVENMEVKVWRNGKQTITQEEVVARPVEEIKDADRIVGVREVKDAGADGKRNATYEVETKDGVEVARKEIASVTTLEAVKQVVVVGTKVTLPAGSHTDWMAAAGIAESDYGYVDYIVSHESGWAPTKYNYGGSGAYGLCQSLPASKMATAGSDYMTNPITQLKWCNGYAIGRYGSWAGAYNFWISRHWW
jgi:uncharacterized protein YabE (DUF348 family)